MGFQNPVGLVLLGLQSFSKAVRTNHANNPEAENFYYGRMRHPTLLNKNPEAHAPGFS